LIRIAGYAHALYGLVFLLAGLYASLLLLTSMWGWQNSANSLIYACGILFIVRAGFAARVVIVRMRAGITAKTRPPFDWLFAIGDAVAVGSLAWTAQLLATGDHRLDTSVVPFGMGLAVAYLFYLIAVCRKLTGHENA